MVKRHLRYERCWLSTRFLAADLAIALATIALPFFALDALAQDAKPLPGVQDKCADFYPPASLLKDGPCALADAGSGRWLFVAVGSTYGPVQTQVDVLQQCFVAKQLDFDGAPSSTDEGTIALECDDLPGDTNWSIRLVDTPELVLDHPKLSRPMTFIVQCIGPACLKAGEQRATLRLVLTSEEVDSKRYYYDFEWSAAQ